MTHIWIKHSKYSLVYFQLKKQVQSQKKQEVPHPDHEVMVIPASLELWPWLQGERPLTRMSGWWPGRRGRSLAAAVGAEPPGHLSE